MVNDNEPSPKLRERVEEKFRHLMMALDAAIAEPTPHALRELCEATDDLMRAAAGIRLAAERAAQLHEVSHR